MMDDDQLEADLWDEIKEFITARDGEAVDTYEVGFDSWVKVYMLLKMEELTLALEGIRSALDDLQRHGMGARDE